MRTKFTFLFSLTAALIFLCQISFAEIVPIEKARQVAKNFFYEKSKLVKDNVAYQDINFESEDIIKENSLPAIYVFKVNNNNGSIMISAESNTYPILFYTFENNFSLTNLTPTMSFFIKNYTSQINETRAKNLPSNEEINKTWEQYSNTVQTKSTTDITTVGPLLKTTWNQDCYYNAMCPTGGSSGQYCSHMPTGCVATAMAQLMKYYGWPAQGTGSHTDVNNAALSANFGATSYNFASMPYNVISANNAVATLMFHAGVSVDMQYAASGSSASLSLAPNALKTYFGYSSNAIYIQKSSYSNVLWNIQIRACLIDSRPVLYRGSDPSTGYGHAFVLDGFQYPEYYHINVGWGGSDNGYYYLSTINTSEGNWNNSQGAVINAYPSNLSSSLPTGINEYDYSKSVNILPNPNNGKFSLLINNEYNGSVTIKIYDVTSRLIEERNVNKNNSIFTENINLSNLNKGIYFISVENGSNKVTKKFIVE